jgi:hypothetical protein
MHPLTKTNYLAYLACPEELWLEKNLAEYQNIAPAPDVLFQMEQGNLIDRLGADYLEQVVFPGRNMLGQHVERQRTFHTERFEARADVAVEHTDTNTIDIYEVKSSTKVKKEHLRDVAFQRMVVEACGYQVGACYLVYTDKTYRLSGTVDLSALFCMENITEQVAAIFTEVQAEAREASDFINGSAPEPQILPNCSNNLDCAFVKHHFSDLPDYSIFDIARLGKKKKVELLERGILDIQEVPADFPLSDTQRRQVDWAQQQHIHIDRIAIAQELESLAYPLYFLDYETLATALPLQDRHHPHQQMLFQYSLHVLDSPGADLQHYEYLLSDQQGMIRKLLASLEKWVGIENGTVIVWNKTFETRVNRAYAEIYPEYADCLLSINERIYDLMEVFKKGYYRHPDFKGKNSLKRVLPVLCPELSYEPLMIKKGTDANVTWYHWTNGEYRGEEPGAIRQALLDYCHLDTLAMVRIWEVLWHSLGS